MSSINVYQANALCSWFMLREARKQEALFNANFPGADFRFPTPSMYMYSFEQCAQLLNYVAGPWDYKSSNDGVRDEAYYEGFIQFAYKCAREELGMADDWAREYLVPKSGIRYVVASANKYGDLITVIGSRHGSPAMHSALNAIREEKLIDMDNRGKAQQGFIDQWDVFMTREEAWEVAVNSGQLNLRRMQSCPGRKELFSEDVW